MNNREKIYNQLPYFLKVFLVNLIAIRKGRQRWNKRVRYLLEIYQSLDYRGYDGRYEGLLRPDLATYTSSKKVVKEHYDSIVDQRQVDDIWYTSGTSGSGLRYPVSKEFVSQLWSFYWKFRGVHGLTHKDWFVYFIGKQLVGSDTPRPPYWIYSHPTRQLLMSQYHLSPDNCAYYLDEIAKSKIKCMHGYPSTLSYFARLIQDLGLSEKAKSCGMKFISCSSEKLLPHQKLVIEQTFGVQVVQIYGMTEGVANVYECDHRRLHVDECFAKVELSPTDIDGINHIVGSSYHNAAFPLYKYSTGDLALMSRKSECPCGRKGRLIEQIIGREDDYISYPNGRKVGRLDHIFKKLENIKESQIFQAEDYSLKFKVVRDLRFDDRDEKELRDEIKTKLGTDLPYEIVYQDKIERASSGKLKAVVSEVKN